MRYAVWQAEASAAYQHAHMPPHAVAASTLGVPEPAPREPSRRADAPDEA